MPSRRFGAALALAVDASIARGYMYKEIAAQLGISAKTVEAHVSALLRGSHNMRTDTAAQDDDDDDPAGTLAALLSAQHGFQRVLDYGGAGADRRAGRAGADGGAGIDSRALLSRDGRETVVLAAFATPTDATTAIARVRAALSRPPVSTQLTGTTVRFGGYALTNQELNELTTSDLARAELLAFPLLLLLSFWFFRGLIAALLPLLVGGFAIVLTFLAKSFSANIGEATEIVFKGPRSAARRLAAAAAGMAGRLASVSGPPAYLGRDTWDIVLLPHGSPYSNVQQRLLGRLRALARAGGTPNALVGGATAFFVDQKSAIASHIPLALLILLPLTAIFLFLMTGSLTIPVKAIVMNMLSVSVAVGLQVLIFQDGHFSSLLAFTPLGGLEESSLVLMLVVAFALATDYEVFVLARIKEAHDRGLPDREAIALGIERTGRIVTAAALLFCVAIGALSTSDLFFTKQLGVGAALAVAVDASIVRALLVPSLMALMGRWNWWAPRPLRRLHDRIGLDEHDLAEASSASVTSRAFAGRCGVEP